MSLINKSPASSYKDVLQVDNGNSGVSTIPKQIKSGSGDGSSLYISEDNLKTQPSADSTISVAHYDEDGNLLFSIDSINDLIKAGINQNNITTQYAYFSIDSNTSSSMGLDHTPLPFSGGDLQALPRFGTGTNPDTYATITTNSDDIVQCLWYIPDGITIDSCSVWVGADASTGDTTRCHLMSFDINKSNTSTGGDLSNGIVLADGVDIVSDGYEQAYFQDMTIQSSLVTSGKVVMFFFKSDSNNSDYSVKSTIKYHLI